MRAYGKDADGTCPVCEQGERFELITFGLCRAHYERLRKAVGGRKGLERLRAPIGRDPMDLRRLAEALAQLSEADRAALADLAESCAKPRGRP